MGTINLLFFLCVKEHFARNLLLLLNTTNRILSNISYLTSFRSHFISTYNVSSRTRSSIASVDHNITSLVSKRGGGLLWTRGVSPPKVRYMTRLSFINPQQNFKYSIDHNKIHPISPLFITGFTDAEGCFNVGFQKNPNGKFYVRPSFQIKVHSTLRPRPSDLVLGRRGDNLLLMSIKNYFGGIGSIYTTSKDSKFTVRSLDDILKIILHFDNYPLITKKKGDFILFKEIILKIVEGEHLSAKGLQEIVNIRSTMNLGLSDSLKTIFPNTVPVTRPLVENITIPHPE